MEELELTAITAETLAGAMQTLRKYKAAKAALDRRIIENEEFWRLRHWEHIPQQGTTGLKTRSAWLVNVILSKHADAMDAYPEPTCLPRARDDEAEARRLSAVVPVVLSQNDFEHTWSVNWWKKLKAGMAVYGVFWDPEKLSGRGDVAIRPVDPLDLYWEPGITDLQDSRNLFLVRLQSRERLLEQYPDLEGELENTDFTGSRYLYDQSVDTSDRVPVIDWYYKKRDGARTVLHYVKFVGRRVLYATENGPLARRGLYDHGLYPFFADVLFPEEGTPGGFGYIDLCKDAQRQIDLMNNAIVANCVAAATPRWLKRGDDGINEEEYADWTRPFVHVQGSLEDSAIRPITVNPLSGNYLNVLAAKVNEIKETSGNRDVNNGGVGGGVTAASAIAAMQEQSGKLSRDQITNAYRCFRQVVYCVIELIRQFYTSPRQFRILGDYLGFDNRGLRGPAVFDIEVAAQKQSSYTKLSYNELALQLFRLGFFNPQLTSQALLALEMMDFKGKEQLQTRLAAQAELVRLLQQPGPSAPGDGGSPLRLPQTDALGQVKKPNPLMEKARARAAAATQPRT